jgi:transcriptional regulator with XRE-family HTH domain
MSRLRLGELIGLSERAVGDLERGKRMNSSHIEPIAIALGVLPRDLFDFEAPLPELPPVAESHRAIVREAISQLERLLK